jgi:peptidoglycan/xylan/chitin deacetylase (PgdA/CDA1 family)
MTRRGVLATAILTAASACDRSSAGSPRALSSSPSGRPSREAPARTATQTPTPTTTPAGKPVTALPRPGRAVVRSRTGVPVLCYHQIREPTADDSATARTYIVRPADFRAQIADLARRGYMTISPDQYYRHLTVGAPLPPRPVMITLDDATVGQWPVAVPALARHRFTATFFVMTVVLDHGPWLTRAQVRKLARLGHTVAAHTWDHHPVTGYTGSDWTTQLARPIAELTELAGRPVRYFAYPYGEWDRRAFRRLAAAGILAAWQLADAPLDPTEPLLTLRRRIVAGDVDLAGFRQLLVHPTT